MDAEQVITIALTVVTPILTAGIGIVALVIGDWRERRTKVGRRKLAFEDASRQVAFASEWWTASKLVADSPEDEARASERAQTWLDDATTLIAESTPPPVDDNPPITLRRLLLADPMRSRGARTLRAFYWFFLGLAALQVSSALGSAFGREDTLGVPNYFSQGFVYGDLIAIAVMMLIAMTFAFLARHVERFTASTEAPARMTLRGALLWYRFSRPVAKFARAVYWLWLVIAILSPIGLVVDAFQDPRLVPGDLVGLVAFVGWTVGIRHWAVSLEERGQPGH